MYNESSWSKSFAEYLLRWSGTSLEFELLSKVCLEPLVSLDRLLELRLKLFENG